MSAGTTHESRPPTKLHVLLHKLTHLSLQLRVSVTDEGPIDKLPDCLDFALSSMTSKRSQSISPSEARMHILLGESIVGPHTAASFVDHPAAALHSVHHIRVYNAINTISPMCKLSDGWSVVETAISWWQSVNTLTSESCYSSLVIDEHTHGQCTAVFTDKSLEMLVDLFEVGSACINTVWIYCFMLLGEHIGLCPFKLCLGYIIILSLSLPQCLSPPAVSVHLDGSKWRVGASRVWVHVCLPICWATGSCWAIKCQNSTYFVPTKR